MSNKHFFKTEYKIFTAYCKSHNHPTARKITTNAKISRATLYRHHYNAQSILRDYEDLILATYSHKIEALTKRKTSTKVLFLRTLIFISRHGKVFRALFTDGRKEIIKQILKKLKPSVTITWRPVNCLDKIYSIYENEVLGVIEIWSEYNFSATKLSRALSDILYLTKTAPERLAPLGSGL